MQVQKLIIPAQTINHLMNLSDVAEAKKIPTPCSQFQVIYSHRVLQCYQRRYGDVHI